MGNYTCGAQNLASRRLSESAFLTVYGLYHALGFMLHWMALWVGGKESEGGFETEQELMNELVSRLGGSLWVNGCSIRKRVLLLLVLYLPLSLYLP